MKNYIVYLLVMIVVICGCPISSLATEEPKLYAKAAVLMDGDTGRVLYGKAPDEVLPMASTTKIMTLILALEYGNPDDVLTVSSYAAKMPDVKLGLRAGENYRLSDLLYSMMLESHNDSACAVAERVGGSVQEFATMMNQKAAEIGLTSTYFITPNGLDAEDAGGVHHTTARELAQLMRYCVTQSEQKEAFQAICQTRQYTFTSCDGTRQFTVYNKNALLDQMDGVLAGKTGFTGNAGYQDPFRPLISGIRFADYNSLDSVKALVNDRTCAIIMETVQGEGGIYPAEKEFLQGVRKICDEHDILLILDEIQCGMGRTGTLWAWQDYSVAPDIMTCAKAIGCGVPVGCFILNEKVAEHSLEPGDHGSTYGGNPFAARAVSTVFDIFEKKDIVGHVREIAPYFEQKLDGLTEKYDCLAERRGKGLMQGLVVQGRPAGEIVSAALEEGLVVITASGNVIRLVPPLVIEKSDIDEMAEKLEKAIEK